ncbi:MAG: hypothetical protein JNM63_16650 [Spirochaetia bacterium]|nr:hypothetical protein [Spirochaetia bacterium]
MNPFFNVLLVCGGRILSWFLLDGKGRLAANVALVIANLVPILGVLFFHWNSFSVLMIYWFESAVIGVFNIARLVSSGAVDKEGLFSVLGLAAGLFLAAFFTVHYGLFLFVHMIFLLVGGSISGALPVEMGDPFRMIPAYFEFQGLAARDVLADPLMFFVSPLFAVSLVLISAAVHFYTDYIRPKAYRILSPQECMMEPYPRIVIMQVAIIFGFILTAVLKWPAGIMAVFVLVKTASDVRLLNRSLRNRQTV